MGGGYRLVTSRAAAGTSAPRAAVLVLVDRLGPGLPTTQELRITFGLRGREPQVALLAAEGLSNAAIAERLRLSAHTVRHYLERVLTGSVSIRGRRWPCTSWPAPGSGHSRWNGSLPRSRLSFAHDRRTADSARRARDPARAADRDASRRARRGRGGRPALGAVVHRGPAARRHARLHRRRARRARRDGPHAAVGVRDARERHRSSAPPAITTSCRRSIAWRSATPGTREPAAHATSTRPASCCCSRTRSTRSAARSWDCGPTTSTSARSARSRGSARRRTASSATTRARRDGTVRDTRDVQHPRRRVAGVRRHLELAARPKAVIHSAASTSAGGSLEARRAGMKVARTTETSSRPALAR